jgi:hypothetical protein
MSTDRDVTRIVRSWIDEGVTVLPDRVLDAVLDQVPATPQRRAGWLARRFPPMNSRFVIWAAVAAAVAVMVFALAPRSNVGTHLKTPTPSATPSALSQGLLRGPLSPGAYRIDEVFPIRATFDLPADWSVGEEFAQGKVELYKALRGSGSGEGALGEVRSNIDAAVISFYVVTNAYIDPCHTLDGPMSPPLGPSVDDLVNVLTSPSGFQAGPISEVTIGGFHGKSFDLTKKIDSELCSADADGRLYQWTYASTDNDMKDEERPAGTFGFQDQRISIIDVNGTRLMIVESIFDWTTPGEVGEMDQIVQSIRFE